MRTPTKARGRRLDEFFARAAKAPAEAVQTSEERVLLQLRSEAGEITTEVRARDAVDAIERERMSRWRTPARIAAALLIGAALSVPLLKTFVFPPTVYAIVEIVDGTLYRVSDGKQSIVAAGERIGIGTLVRTDDGARAILTLSDGARIEMHPESALALEQASRGTRIRVDDGLVNVKPAIQPTASLYVQNQEVTAPITVAAEPEPRFEVASIRLVASMAERLGQRGAAPGVEPRPVPADIPTGPRCIAPGRVTLNPGRLSIANATLWHLIAIAYGNPCPLEKDLSGGSMWIQGDLYEIDAIIPAGTPAYTKIDFIDGKAPRLQRMLQNLLADRFKLRLSREMKEFPAYNLLLVNPGKLKVADPARAPAPWATGPIKFRLSFENLSMTLFSKHLATLMNQHVIDQTGAKGLYDFNIEQPMPNSQNDPMQEMRTTLSNGLEQELGMKLESTRALVELLVIAYAERPSEN